MRTKYLASKANCVKEPFGLIFLINFGSYFKQSCFERTAWRRITAKVSLPLEKQAMKTVLHRTGVQ